MKRSLVIFYAVALACHAAVLFYLKPPAPHPPKMIERTYVDIALTAPPAPETPTPQPPSPPPVPQQKVDTPPQPKPEPTPAKAEITIPTPKLELPPPPIAQPVVIPQPKPPPEYVSVTQPNYARRAEPIYPEQSRRWRQQGIVVLALFINEFGTLNKVEIVKSSGFQLLDAAAIKAMKQSQFAPRWMARFQSVRARKPPSRSSSNNFGKSLTPRVRQRILCAFRL